MSAIVLSPAATSTPLSIRQIVRQGLLARKSTKEIAEVIREHHPDSAAAAKSVKHIAFYRCQMKKAGEI